MGLTAILRKQLMLRFYVFRKRSPTTAAASEHSKYGKMDTRGGRTLHDLDVEKFWLHYDSCIRLKSTPVR